MNSIRVFPFFILFFCWNETNNKSSIKEDTRKMENCRPNHILNWSSRSEVFCEKRVLKNFAKFTGKPLCQSLWFLAGFIERETPAKAFSYEFWEISKTSFLTEHLQWLLLFRVNRVSDHYARNTYHKGLSMNNCSVNVSAIKDI